MKPKLQQLKEAIIKEIPEIVELKMGCFVEVEKNSGEKEILSYRNKTTLIKRDDIFRTDGCGCCSINYSEEKVKIIGRKITLADVLRVLEKKSDSKTFWSIGFNGRFHDEDETCYSNPALFNKTWNFSKNDLSLQSKPIIDFLSKIILKGDD